MKHNDWTDRLHDRLSDYKAVPPVGLWDKIETAVDGRRKRARTVRMRVWAAAAAVALLLISGAGYLLNRNTISQLDSRDAFTGVSGNAGRHTADARRGSTDIPEETKVTEATGGLVAVNNVPASVADCVADVVEENAAERDARHTGETVAETAGSGAAANEEDEGEGKDRDNVSGRDVGMERMPARPASYDIRKDRERGGAWTVGAYSSNMFGNSGSMNSVNVISRVTADYSMTENMLKASSASFSNYSEENKHYLPLSFGLTAGYALTDRIRVSSGIVYSRLASDFIRSSDGEETTDRQTLHYIGVPLNVSYDIWSTRRFKAYVTAGGQADFNVSARVETEGVKTKMDRDNVQWSVSAAAGAQYDVIPQLGVYVEPGVRYYIDNGSRIENYYKDKPVSFSLQLGLRLNIE